MWQFVAAAFSIYSGIKGAQGAASAARAQSTEAMANAKYLRQQAEFSRYMASLDIEAADVEHERHRGAQESVFAAAGVSLSGSVMAALGESEKSMERNHFRRLIAAENDANMMIKRADMNDRLARNIESAGETRAQAALLGGLAQGVAFAGQGFSKMSPSSKASFKSFFGFGGTSSRAVNAGSSTLTGGIGIGAPIGIGIGMPSPVGARQLPGFASPGPFNPYANAPRRLY